MLDRYSSPETREIWSEKKKYETWYRVERAIYSAAHVPDLPDIQFDVDRIGEIEKTTRHDVIAFLTYLEEVLGPRALKVHMGCTSSDIVDTGFSLLLLESTEIIRDRLEKFIRVLERMAYQYSSTPMIGRSHGIHAEPTTFGLFLAGHLSEAKRNMKRLVAAREEVRVGKVSGAVGTYTHLSPEVEKIALESLGLRPETISTQVVARDRYAAYFSVMALIAGGIERLAVNLRHLQRTEVGEVEERFGAGQKGSSAMPHKKNPISSENLCGLARVVRSHLQPALENIPLWHERDISHSSVERHIAPDSTSTVVYMLERITGVMENLVVKVDRMRKNLDSSNGLIYSESVLLSLVDKGVPRQVAYVMVQRNALESHESGVSFKKLIIHDPGIEAHLTKDEIEGCFDLEHCLRYSQEIIDRVVSEP
jgi:adenylosuccinate lyase